MKKRLLKPWQTLAVLTAAGVLAACDPAAPPAPKATAASPTAAVPAARSALYSLQSYVGNYPSDSQVNFLEQGALAQRLKQLLGNQYVVFLTNMRTVGPLQEDVGRWFITGNRPHEGGVESAAVVVDPQQNALRVWMLHEGRQSEYQDPPGAYVAWPAEVRTLQRNAQRHIRP